MEWGSGGNAAFHRAYTGVWVNRMVMDASAPLRARVAARLDANGAVKEQSSVWWPRFSYEPTPEGTWWDDLPGFRKQLTDRIATRWQTFRGSIDEAIREGA